MVERLDGEYHLTEAGEDLRGIVFGVAAWGAKWQFGEPREDELDAELLLFWAHDRIDFGQFPARRIVLQFAFRGDPRRFWVVKDAGGPSLCTTDPEFDVDVVVHADLAALQQVWVGRVPLSAAMRDGSVEFEGPPALVRRMPDALLLSPVADIVAANAS